MSARSGSLPWFILQRVMLMIPMLLILLTVVFLLLRVAPGDPVTASVGDRLPPEQIEQRREALGLNDPLIVQYLRYLGDVATLNFGQSLTDNQPIFDTVKQNGGATLSLTLAAFLVALCIGIPLGLLAGRFRDTPLDVAIRLFGILTYAAPIFFLGLLAQLYVAPAFGLPTSTDASTETKYLIPDRTNILLIDALLTGDGAVIKDVLLHLVLPAVTLGLLICGVFIRLVRVNILQTMKSDYVEAAQARGLAGTRVMRTHAFRNALVPVITVIGIQVAMLLGGAVLTEQTFNWPGLGQKLVYYIENRDYPAVQGLITLFAVVVISISLLIDIVNALIDPRVRY